MPVSWFVGQSGQVVHGLGAEDCREQLTFDDVDDGDPTVGELRDVVTARWAPSTG